MHINILNKFFVYILSLCRFEHGNSVSKIWISYFSNDETVDDLLCSSNLNFKLL